MILIFDNSGRVTSLDLYGKYGELTVGYSVFPP